MNTDTLKSQVLNIRASLFQIDRQRDQLNDQLEQLEAQLAYAQQLEAEAEKAGTAQPEA